MWRMFVTTCIAYGCGHPVHDAYRPAVFDRPLQAFHETVNIAALEGKKGVAYVGDSRAVRYLKDSIADMGTRLRSDSR
jgi:hypothetical protein